MGRLWACARSYFPTFALGDMPALGPAPSWFGVLLSETAKLGPAFPLRDFRRSSKRREAPVEEQENRSCDQQSICSRLRTSGSGRDLGIPRTGHANTRDIAVESVGGES